MFLVSLISQTCYGTTPRRPWAQEAKSLLWLLTVSHWLVVVKMATLGKAPGKAARKAKLLKCVVVKRRLLGELLTAVSHSGDSPSKNHARH
jgi:hypothetical protein